MSKFSPSSDYLQRLEDSVTGVEEYSEELAGQLRSARSRLFFVTGLFVILLFAVAFVLFVAMRAEMAARQNAREIARLKESLESPEVAAFRAAAEKLLNPEIAPGDLSK